MGLDASISGADHGWRCAQAVGWQKLPVPERDMVAGAVDDL
jgi:hypothetical protein